MIEYVTIDQAAELDAFVLRQPNCHFMQTSAWGTILLYYFHCFFCVTFHYNTTLSASSF